VDNQDRLIDGFSANRGVCCTRVEWEGKGKMHDTKNHSRARHIATSRQARAAIDIRHKHELELKTWSGISREIKEQNLYLWKIDVA
jgi:hypothetical protein